MIERAEFDDRPPEQLRLAWCAWMRHHGIDPDVVPIPGWVERDEQARRVVLEVYVLDEQGRKVANEDQTVAVREVQVVQLEAAPSPFPC